MILLRQRMFGIIGDYLDSRGMINRYKEMTDGLREANSETGATFNSRLNLSYGKKGKYDFEQHYKNLDHRASKKMDEEIIKKAKKHNNSVLIRRSAPWVIGGTLAAAGTVAGVKALKKKKSKKEDKNK